MSEVKRIRNQLKRAYQGIAWHGPSLKELLEGVSAQQASARPIAGAHTIWELVLHVIAWERVAIRRLAGDQLEQQLELTDAENFPAVTNNSETEWQAALARLEQTNSELREAIAQLTDDRLQEIVPGCQYDYYFLLHGVIQHDLYHAGQIALLKKA